MNCLILVLLTRFQGGKDVYLRLISIIFLMKNIIICLIITSSVSPGEPTYKGIPLNAKVFPGWGRTYNLGLTKDFKL